MTRSGKSSQSSADRLAGHVSESIDTVVEFNLEHSRRASPLQRGIDGLTERLGRPAVVVGIVLFLAAWIILARIATRAGVDSPQFAWLELTGTLAALIVSMLILVTQRREDLLAERRAQLTLELALLADKKSSKIIALLEELRRDHPDVADRIDLETDEMATPADPHKVLAAIDEKAGQASE